LAAAPAISRAEAQGQSAEERFRSLTPEKQEELRQRYRDLQQLPPEERQRIQENLARLNRMSPDEHAHVDESYRRFLAMPPMRRVDLAVRAPVLGPFPNAGRPNAPRRPPPPAQQGKPLSDEDAEVVKQLALLEQVDLLRNLDLFEPSPPPPQQASQQPDAGP